METRKIIGFGKSTFSMTLPKKWIIKNKLSKGDTVSIRELPMGRLEVSPASREEVAEVKTISIDINGKLPKEIQREFTAAYTKGYSVIHLLGDHDGKVSELRRRLHELIAMEIMEVAPKRITANVFFDVSTISLPRILSRLELTIHTILGETQDILRKGDSRKGRYKEIMEKKREISRQSLFAIRIIVNALRDPVFASRIGEEPLKLALVWHLIEYMEKISDYILNISFYLTSTDFLKALGKKGNSELLGIFASVEKTYESAMKSYNKNSLPLANQVFDMHTKNDRQLYNCLHHNQHLWTPLITNHLRRISSKSRDIARITISLNTTGEKAPPEKG